MVLTWSFSFASACSAMMSLKLRVGVCPANASPPRIGDIYRTIETKEGGGRGMGGRDGGAAGVFEEFRG